MRSERFVLTLGDSTFAGSVVKVTYGFDIEEKDDRYIALMEKLLEGLQAFIPGKYVAQFMPSVAYMPRWVPGAGFHRDFDRWRGAADEVREGLLTRVKAGLVSMYPPRRVNLLTHPYTVGKWRDVRFCPSEASRSPAKRGGRRGHRPECLSHRVRRSVSSWNQPYHSIVDCPFRLMNSWRRHGQSFVSYSHASVIQPARL